MQAYAHWLHVAIDQKFWKEKVNAPVQIEAGVGYRLCLDTRRWP